MTIQKPPELSAPPQVFEPLPQDYDGSSTKTFRKIRENPMVPIGMAGFFVAVAYGIRNFKNRPKTMNASMYIMRFRVFAQSIAVGAMGLGIGYTIVKNHFAGKDGNATPDRKT